MVAVNSRNLYQTTASVYFPLLMVLHRLIILTLYKQYPYMHVHMYVYGVVSEVLVKCYNDAIYFCFITLRQ